MNAKPGSIPEDHDGCIGAGTGACVECQANEWLLASDWEIVRFYRMVADQVSNLAPLGTKDGKGWLVPRLADWLAASELMGVTTLKDKRQLIEQARFLHNAIQGKIKTGRVFEKDPESMMPAVDWSDDA